MANIATVVGGIALGGLLTAHSALEYLNSRSNIYENVRILGGVNTMAIFPSSTTTMPIELRDVITIDYKGRDRFLDLQYDPLIGFGVKKNVEPFIPDDKSDYTITTRDNYRLTAFGPYPFNFRKFEVIESIRPQ